MVPYEKPSQSEISLEQTSITPETPADLFHAVELAFDYRGDVTLEMKSGESVVGYLFGRRTDEVDPYAELYLDNTSEKCVVRYQDIHAIHFSGKDTAVGKSWEAWINATGTRTRSGRGGAVDSVFGVSGPWAPRRRGAGSPSGPRPRASAGRRSACE